MTNFEFGKQAQENAQLNEQQLAEVSRIAMVCMINPEIKTKTQVYDYIEANASSKRVAIVAAMYLGYRMSH